MSANDIEWNILLKKFINQRRTSISVFGSVTDKGKNPVRDHYYIYAILLLVLHYWFCIVGFEIDEFIISEILLFDFEHEYVMSIYMYQRLMA